MTTQRTMLDAALFWVLPLSLVAFVLVLWLVSGVSPAEVTALLAALMLANLGAGVVRQARRQGRMDEVQVAAIRFGALWSPVAVSLMILLVVAAPPLQAGLVEFGAWNEARFNAPGTGGAPPAAAMFAFGAVAALFVQMSAQSALRAAWMWSKR